MNQELRIPFHAYRPCAREKGSSQMRYIMKDVTHTRAHISVQEEVLPRRLEQNEAGVSFIAALSNFARGQYNSHS